MTTITREQAQKIIDAADEVITALAGTNDDFHPDNSEKMCGLWDDLNDRYAPPEVVRELARAMLASMDAEPAGYHVIKECGKIGCSVATLEEAEKTRDFWNKKWIIKPYFHSAPPASERERIRREHAEWSDDSFGDVGSVGPLKHLSKEAIEAAAEPDDLSKWADMQFLLWDAQRRAGITDEQITRALIEKLAVNKKREWPEPKDGEPRLHIKEQPAPLMLDKDELLPCPFCGGKARQVTIEQGDDPNFGGDVITCIECGASSHVEFGFKENLKSAWNSRAAMLQGKFRDLSQPVDPQVTEYEQIMLQAGWVMVPVEPTDEMIAAAMECDDVVFDSKDPTAFCVQFREIYYAMVDAAPKQENI
ncbi:restriction alleviation protein, Lar family [Salmonella enterica]|nr:restriction alleviation protein, Lar family [Salmonella enterica]EEG9158530.1 restriction alleviation protein, Lar family [Salmonella enterica]